uniref:SET domain-containing protein n=1 Tax=Chlamydomonas euryale TaxID=1486919 RepID=A0A7R9VHC9_9CHLO
MASSWAISHAGSRGLLARANGRRLAVAVAAKRNVHKAPPNNKPRVARLELDNERLYTDAAYLPPPGAGPITLVKAPGGGRAILATANIAPGEVVMVSSPVAFQTAPVGTDLRPEQLLQALDAAQLSDAGSHRISLLYDGTVGSTSQVVPLDQFFNAEAHVKKAAAKAKAAAKGFGAKPVAAREPALATCRGFGDKQADSSVSQPPSADTIMQGGAAAPGRSTVANSNSRRLEAVVKFNAYGHEHRDLAACEARQEDDSAYVGLWPEYALLNHSCAPNTSATLVGDRLVIRASRAIERGSDVTVSYLQEMAMTPAQRRRQYLSGAYGFTCMCNRCKLEDSQPEAVKQRVQSIHETVSSQEWQARTQAAYSSKDARLLRQMQEDAKALTDALEKDMDEAKVGPEVQPWLRASAYSAYFLQALGSDVGKKDQLAVPRSLLPYVAIVAPASDVHLLLTLEVLLRAAEQAKDSKETESATRACILAATLRYGNMSQGLLTKILDAIIKRDSYMGIFTVARPASRSTAAAATSEAVSKAAAA